MARVSVTYNGVTVGPGPIYTLVAVKGLDDMASVRRQTLARPNTHGSFLYSQYLDERVVELAIVILGSSQSDYEARVLTLATAFQFRTATELPLVYTLGDATLVKRINCRPVRFEVSREVRNRGQQGVAVVQLVASDPRRYDNTLTTATANLPSVTSGGLGFPFAWPIGFGGTGTGGLLTVTNSGNIEAPATFTVLGPCTDPVVTNDTVSASLHFSIVLESTDTLSVDLDQRLITLNGAANRNNTLTTASTWWLFQPGANSIRFTAASGSGGAALLTVPFRSAWS